MMSMLRRINEHKIVNENEYKAKLEELPSETVSKVEAIRKLEIEADRLIVELEESQKKLEREYFERVNAINEQKSKIIKESKEELKDYWLTALLKHKVVGMGITEKDKSILKSLESVKIEENKDKRECTLIFEFSENEAFNNKEISKIYEINEESLLVSVKSDSIEWKKEDWRIKKELKKIRNMHTGEVKEIEVSKPNDTFFNFFFDFTLPNKDSVKNLSKKSRSEVGHKLDMEYEMLMELAREVVPYSLDYYLGLRTTIESYSQ